jgi:two-component system sensor histidine kinase MtrB
LFHVQRIVLFLPRLVGRVWHGSLWLRVTITTLALSIVVVSVLGIVLLSRVTTGLLDAKERASVALSTAGVGEAQRLLDAADTGPSTPSPARLVDGVVGALAAQAGSPSTFDVLLLSTQGDAPERGTNLVDQESVPTALRESVSSTKRLRNHHLHVVYSEMNKVLY